MTQIYTRNHFYITQSNFETITDKIVQASKSKSPFIRLRITKMDDNKYINSEIILLNTNLIEAVLPGDDAHA